MTTETETATPKKPSTAGTMLQMAAWYTVGWLLVQVLTPLVRLLLVG